MPKVIIINGYPASGKDTFVEFCAKYGAVENVLTSTPAKEAIKLLGWDGEKTPEVRDLLSMLIDASYELFNGPTKYVLEKIEQTEAEVLFIHCREPYNITRFKDAIQDNVLTVFMDREEAREGVFRNHADREVEDYNYDLTIPNNGTLKDLENYARSFMAVIRYFNI